MASFFLGSLTKFGFSMGAGLGVTGGLFYYLAVLTERLLDNRRALKIRRNSTRRPPSVSGNTEPLPQIEIHEVDEV